MPYLFETIPAKDSLIRLACSHTYCPNCWTEYVRTLPHRINCVLCRQSAGVQTLCTLVDGPSAADDQATDEINAAPASARSGHYPAPMTIPAENDTLLHGWRGPYYVAEGRRLLGCCRLNLTEAA